MIGSPPRALSFRLNVSNTLRLAQSSSRFGRLGPPLFSFSAALDPPLDVLQDGTTPMLDPVLPPATPKPCTVFTVHPCSAYKSHPQLTNLPTHHLSHLPRPLTVSAHARVWPLLTRGGPPPWLLGRWRAQPSSPSTFSSLSLCPLLLTVFESS
jgi:hypothetical protein